MADPAQGISRALRYAANTTHPDFEQRPVMSVALGAPPSAPIVLDIPHAGRDYPAALQRSSRLDATLLRRSEDAHVDDLFGGAQALGVPSLIAHFPRAWLDVNREPYELDPRMLDGSVPSYANTRSVRVAGGLGTVPRLVAEGQDIYHTRLPVREALSRIESVYKPYHAALRELLAATHAAHGRVLLLDCHSMPSAVRGGEAGRPDIVVGDRFGTSSGGAITDLVVSALRRRGFKIARNKPYAGGFVTEHYGRPARGLHAIQLELNRALYMNELSYERTAGFEALRNELTGLVADIREGMGGETYLEAAE